MIDLDWENMQIQTRDDLVAVPTPKDHHLQLICIKHTRTST